MPETVEVILPRLPLIDNDPRILATFEVLTRSDVEQIVIRQTAQREVQVQPQAIIAPPGGGGGGGGGGGDDEEEDSGRTTDPDVGLRWGCDTPRP